MSVADTDIKGINVISSNEVNLFVKMKKKRKGDRVVKMKKSCIEERRKLAGRLVARFEKTRQNTKEKVI